MYGKKLKEIRTRWMLTQDKMASLLNVSARTYTSYEREENNPPYSMLVNLCKEHDINLNWFIANVGEMFIKKEPVGFREEIKQAFKEMIASGELSKDDFK